MKEELTIKSPTAFITLIGKDLLGKKQTRYRTLTSEFTPEATRSFTAGQLNQIDDLIHYIEWLVAEIKAGRIIV